MTADVTTSTALAANATWTSEAVHRGYKTAIYGLVETNATGTLHLEQSFDGENWIDTDDLAVSASRQLIRGVDLVAPYWRVKLVNGAAAQTSLLVALYAR